MPPLFVGPDGPSRIEDLPVRPPCIPIGTRSLLIAFPAGSPSGGLRPALQLVRRVTEM